MGLSPQQVWYQNRRNPVYCLFCTDKNVVEYAPREDSEVLITNKALLEDHA